MIKIDLLLWLSRIVCFVLAYQFHSYQSLVPLIWIIHSTIYTSQPLFVNFTIYMYLPLMYLCYLFYFITNVYGVVHYNEWSTDKQKEYYLYGFYDFRNPEWIYPSILVSIWALAVWCR
jgi:hypothetical protein